MHNMKVENGVVALLAVTSYAGTGSAGALASSAVESATAAAPSGGAKDTPCWGLSPVGRVLGGASGRGGRKLGLCDGRVEAGPTYYRQRVRSRRSRSGGDKEGSTTPETGSRRPSALGVRGGAVVSDPYNARMQVMITRNMRKVLVEELGYLSEEVDDMDPQIAAVVIEKSLPRPRAGMPIAWRRSIRQRKAGGPLFLHPVRLLAAAVETAAGAVVSGAVAVAAFPFVAMGKGFGAVRAGGAKGVASAVLMLGVTATLAVLVTSSLSEDGGVNGMFPGSAGLRPVGETLAAVKALLPARKGKKGDGAIGSSTAGPGARDRPDGGGDSSAKNGGGGGGGGGGVAAKWTGASRRRRGQSRRRSKADSKDKEEKHEEGGLNGGSGLEKRGRTPSGNSSSSKKHPRNLGQPQQERRDGGSDRTMGAANPRATSENRGAQRLDDLPETPLAPHETGLIDEGQGEEEEWEEPGPPHRWGRTAMDEHIPSEQEMEAWEDTAREPDSWLDRRIDSVVGSLFGRGGGGKDDKAPPR